MLGKLTKIFLGKELVLYSRHRQTIPIVNNCFNKKQFIFISSTFFWRLIPLRSKHKLKHKVMYLFLSFINPKYIIDINWITIWQGLYKVWTKNHPNSKFIVVQHGSYVGGIVTDIAHRYTKCDVFFVWSHYFQDAFLEYNRGKKLDIVVFGNPVLNPINRNQINYKTSFGNKILVATSVIEGDRMDKLYDLLLKLNYLKFDVTVKEHAYQNIKSSSIIFSKKITGSISEILSGGLYDIIITDHSTVLLDSVFFKHFVLYFDPGKEYINSFNTIYSLYLNNIANSYQTYKNREDLFSEINVENQERLLEFLISKGCNSLKLNY